MNLESKYLFIFCSICEIIRIEVDINLKNIHNCNKLFPMLFHKIDIIKELKILNRR